MADDCGSPALKECTVWLPYARRNERFFWREVEVQHGLGSAERPPQLRCHMSFERGFVSAEADIAVNTHYGVLFFGEYGHSAGAAFLAYRCHERFHRLLHHFPIERLALPEPFAFVVLFQLLQEPKSFRRKAVEF